MGAGFASTDRFVSEISSNKLRAGYVLIGDEIFLYERCRRAVLEHLVPADLRDFCLSEIDLAETSIFEALDRAQTPSLMATSAHRIRRPSSSSSPTTSAFRLTRAAWT
jgi:DNA polymerase-3 subunit delta